MINFINKILTRFQLKLISTKPINLVEESVRFLDSIPKSFLSDHDFSTYVGDIVYLKDKKTGKIYYRQIEGKDFKYFCDCDGDDNVPFEEMYNQTTFTEETLKEKLNNG